MTTTRQEARNRRGRAGLLAGALAALAFGVAGLGAQEAGGTRVDGGIYLFHYQPLALEGVDPKSEVYAAFARVRHRSGPWEVLVEARARDDRLRDFFPGNVWFQEAWLAYHATGPDAPTTLTLRAGKAYQRTGRFWDGSFFGNLHYFDGLKLNPQFLLEAVGQSKLGPVRLGYRAQYVLDSDRVSGAFIGRDFETLPDLVDRHGAGGRLTAVFPGGVTVGGTLFSRGFRGKQSAPEVGGESWRALHASADVELARGPFRGYVELLRRGDADLPAELARTVAGTEATYLLVGAQWHQGRFHARYNVSRADYEALDRVSWIHQPGLTWDLSENASALAELDYWIQESEGGETVTFDRSLNLVLLLTF